MDFSGALRGSSISKNDWGFVSQFLYVVSKIQGRKLSSINSNGLIPYWT